MRRINPARRIVERASPTRLSINTAIMNQSQKESYELIVLDFASGTVTTYTLPETMTETPEIRGWIAEETPHRLDDIEWMAGDDIERVDGDYIA